MVGSKPTFEQLGLEQLGDALGVARRDRQRDRLGVARLLEDAGGLVRVVGVDAVELGVVADVPVGERLVGDLAEPELAGVDEGLAVDGEVQGLDDLGVVERLHRLVHVERRDVERGHHLHLEAGGLGRLELAAGQQADVVLAGLQRRDHGGRLGRGVELEVRDRDAVGLEVLVVLVQHRLGVLHVGVEDERARAGRLGGQRVRVGLEDRGVHDHAGLAGEQERVLVVGPGELEGEGEVVVGRHVRQVRQLRGDQRVVGVAAALEALLDGLRVDRAAVAEDQPVLERERDGLAVLGVLPRLDQVRLRVALVVDEGERRVGQREHLHVGAGRGRDRVPRGRHLPGPLDGAAPVPAGAPLRVAATRLQGGESADAEDGAEQRAPAQVEGGLGDARGSGHRSIDLSGTGRKSGVRSGCSGCWDPFNTFTTDLLYLNDARVAHPAHSPDAC